VSDAYTVYDYFVIQILRVLEEGLRKDYTYTGDHGMAAANLCVSRKVFDRIKDFTLLGRC
jgi:hypothetical protein